MNAVITGANRGIGMSMVQAFAKGKYDIWACARSQNDEFERTLADFSQKYGVCIRPIYFDITDEKAVRSAVKKMNSDKQTIDVLINNAGVGYNGTLMMTPLEKIREVYEINVFAQIQLMQFIARSMIRQRSGVIINLCSVGGIEARPGYIAYGSSKAAMVWLTKAVARELGDYGIRVNGIAPGLIDTDMGHLKSETELQKVFDRMVIKRFGRPEEVAKAAVYLASDEAEFMTGQILVIDGGRVV